MVDLGEPLYSGATTVTYEAAEALSPGDVVAINSGQVAKADDTTDTNALAVVASTASNVSAGENVAVHVAGVVVANVANGVSAGTELGVSATEGQLAAGSDGFQPLTDEGAPAGLEVGSIPAGGAAVKIP